MDYKSRFKPLIPAAPVIHGGPGPGADDLESPAYSSYTDFSVSLNPYPVPESVRDAAARVLHDEVFFSYTERSAESFCKRAAEAHNTRVNRVSAFNGISQAVFFLSYLMLDKTSRVLVCGPAYSEYEACSRMTGAAVETLWSDDRHDFIPDTRHLCSRVAEYQPEILWLCNPNNPTGRLIDAKQMQSIYEACVSAGTLLVIDEAYMNFAAEAKRFSFSGNDCVVLRSMTKDYSLPGLRLGYVIAPAEITTALNAVKPPWSVNAVAAVAGIAAFDSAAEYEQQWKKLLGEKNVLEAGLSELEFRIIPSAANFILCECPGGAADSIRIIDKLLEQKIMVRDCTSFGLPGYIRLGVRTADENRLLVNKLKGALI